MINCQDLQLNLPLYSDDILPAGERAALDEHVAECPLCRQKLVDFQDLRNMLRSAERPVFPDGAFYALRKEVESRLLVGATSPAFGLIDDRRRWLDVWLMPYSVGASASLIVGISLLWMILSGSFQSTPEISALPSGTGNSAVMLANTDSDAVIEMTPSEYANSRMAFGAESPSINPRGALVALTESFVGREVEDDEVVVVADVYSNGRARITEIVEPSRDQGAVVELRKALESDKSYAAFVPARFDHRSETIRVVLKIQSVNVSTSMQ